jgi:hypothetical protein
VYAGSDPVTGKRHDLTELVPPGPKAAAEAERVRTRLLSQVDERRNPRTKATVNQLLDRYVEVLDVEQATRTTYLGSPAHRLRRCGADDRGERGRPPIGDVAEGHQDAPEATGRSGR